MPRTHKLNLTHDERFLFLLHLMNVPYFIYLSYYDEELTSLLSQLAAELYFKSFTKAYGYFIRLKLNLEEVIYKRHFSNYV